VADVMVLLVTPTGLDSVGEHIISVLKSAGLPTVVGALQVLKSNITVLNIAYSSPGAEEHPHQQAETAEKANNKTIRSLVCG
jgi:hypothetical protein